MPTPFVLEFSAEVADCDASEKAAHHALQKYREAENREFFRVSVRMALQSILPVIGSYRIREVKSSHGIEAIEEELKNRRLEAERQAAAKRSEIRRRELERQHKKERRRKEIEAAITNEQRKLQQLGSRPIKKELPNLASILMLAYWPIPIGWITWLSALSILDPKGEKRLGLSVFSC